MHQGVQELFLYFPFTNAKKRKIEIDSKNFLAFTFR